MYQQIESNKRKTWLLISIFILVIASIGWFLDYYMDAGYGILIFALVLSIVMSVTSYYKSDKIALFSTGAKEIQKDDSPYVYRMVENLCITSGIPMPKVHIINSQAMNAFATGRDPEHASIALTSGIIEALENEELEGVIAHELSHIKNYDIRLMTIVVVLVGIIALVGDFFLRWNFFGGHSRSSNDNKGGNGIILIIGIIFILLSPIIAEIIKLAISRKREYMADASGSLLTRYPEGLARALEKINQSPAELKTASTATAHLFISNPLKKKTLSRLFSTHPPSEDRIKKLREMA
ncbi:MAG: zinc metalloprotease HtpX [Candidatus Magasanikbacteria bacterium RIFCSPHIGHO2_01_FULL_33_34]|uniref:Protease HtpX homolog n=1 Tax=Candidatus Magasanikbacteria bacterium RIFCSPHIGHO2_01_FULL_33_34 TaxID=1798671 RepID=A0A1F6LKP1_9BACT|nr:MAG: zinc metalloprotease HtpX [Candidatus Magasanikbacteria bacterium RIFCSPHIGHO2_01_FULL_33_34]OGH65708.1 MAG: zinc metalloprotease HtpX [Candidatus Magasanikbacteria bacterium RIFCSPHIGHO2_02_FULL_33_17]OGH76321.1 MAG: zinc metalloprotease HtpX [Candidatus Magasanikbacteria bacterium RIFCSPLOWO2_01_FULL_33_34]